ncbi:hypothetical protein [Paenibacillus physcomitrellae]|uniref:Uncharacterized protein n=1 Tax=Paenibacillus physcomitrellae TaxID=1619311 RepID=A0ABQ1FXE4_9BACL|nr:hypothetical protein [Paenibacillus physcomitrellae]GGA33238.1 hypothetical protein GCM10010917_17960 [Paenibacillus physcomitrellae]
MVLKSLKSKIAVGVIGVSLVAGMSTVFAGVDAGAQFSSWYHGLFVSTSGQVQAGITADYAKKVGQYTGEYNSLKTSSKQEIKNEVGTKTTSAETAINDYKDAYVGQINTAKDNINVAGDFNTFAETVNHGVDITAGQLSKAAQNDLKNTLNAQGKQSVTDVNKQVTQKKDSATADLTAKINAAKDDIQELVNEQSAVADQAIRAHIDAQIAALEKTISDYAAQLVKENKDDIDAEGDKVQDAAIAELDAIAGSINKK